MKHSGTKDLPGPAHSLKDSIAHKESPASGGPDSRAYSTAKSYGGIDSSIALVAHIVLHIKVSLLVEALIQGIAQQHTPVVCQILQIKLKRPNLKAITHQGT